MNRDAVKDLYTDGTLLQTVQFIDGLTESALPMIQLFDQRQQSLSLPCETNTVALPQEQRQSGLFLHGIDDIADSRLRVSQCIRRLPEAAGLGHCEKYGCIDFIHPASPPSKNNSLLEQAA